MNAQIKTPAVATHATGRRIFANLLETMTAGFDWCDDCEAIRERIISDQGQPDKCAGCGSTKIHFQQFKATTK